MNEPPTVMPRISILIPNYNNGCESAIDGKRNFLEDLLASLWRTLVDDPVAVEIIIADDGSTDDSLETARRWASRTWRQGGRDEHAFCRLLEFEHRGVLSEVANDLMDASSGEICCRLDGDIEIHTMHWASVLCDAFDRFPKRVGVIGPKQLTPDGYVHAAGDWLLHPRGYHHVAQGITPNGVTRSIEVDHVMGCFYCLRRSTWEDVGQYDTAILRGQTVDYGLRARLNDWACMSIPTIEYTHYHALRVSRQNTADTDDGLQTTLDAFREKWGFDRLVPDLDAVAERYAGTPLIWNANVFGPLHDSQPMSNKQPTFETSRWVKYEEDKTVQLQIEQQASIVGQVLKDDSSLRRVVHLGSQEGLVAHRLAQHGVSVTGVERCQAFVDIAKTVAQRATYPGEAPCFVHQDDFRTLPLGDGSSDLIVMFGGIEQHPNPVGFLREVFRVLRSEGVFLLFTPARTSPLDHETDRMHRFRSHELTSLIANSGWFNLKELPDQDKPESLCRYCIAKPERIRILQVAQPSKARSVVEPRQTSAVST